MSLAQECREVRTPATASHFYIPFFSRLSSTISGFTSLQRGYATRHMFDRDALLRSRQTILMCIFCEKKFGFRRLCKEEHLVTFPKVPDCFKNHGVRSRSSLMDCPSTYACARSCMSPCVCMILRACGQTCVNVRVGAGVAGCAAAYITAPLHVHGSSHLRRFLL
jgi:hypothetical protein